MMIIIINTKLRGQNEGFFLTTLELGTDTNAVTAGLRRLTAMNYRKCTTVTILSLL
jgi:hypothetical protein